MAAASIKHSAHKLFGSHSSSIKSEPVDAEQREKEKQFITDFLNQQHFDPPPLNRVGTQDKKLGCASHQLSVKDFKLQKTIGTGQCTPEDFLENAWQKINGRVFRDLCTGMAVIAGGSLGSDQGQKGLCSKDPPESR